ncbi:DUF2933 domain-containing protein [Candidatus Peregrinibacteria bacterium]|nr:DUF2933 domain-containing protein [Candidatus Peregrinibacteria bacterium]MBI2523993.1 DUF2933 domain-containing protein [Candidatus Peregrinibacteria bacterium]MBI4129270.1 DUF2933 domain-containing protein [Candidatus Peregrinibacteria bacterium]
MLCCSRKTLFILLGVTGVIGLLMVTGKVNAYAIVPFLPILACPLMCVVMHMFGRKENGGTCHTDQKKPSVKH